MTRFVFLAVSHTRTVDPLHQLDFALSVSTTSFRGPVVRSNGQRAGRGKLLVGFDLRQISDFGRVKKRRETQVFLTSAFICGHLRNLRIASPRIYVPCIRTSDALRPLRAMKLKTFVVLLTIALAACESHESKTLTVNGAGA